MVLFEVQAEWQDIALALITIIALFPAYVFWLGYRRVGTKVMLYPAIAFALYSLRTFTMSIMDEFEEIHVFIELIILTLLALALLEKPKGEMEANSMLEETLQREEDGVGREKDEEREENEKTGGNEKKAEANGTEDSDLSDIPDNPDGAP